MFLKVFSTTLLLAQIPTNVDENSCAKFSSTYCTNQPLVPIVKVSDKCPSGFFANGGYCFPLTKDVMGVIPIYDGKLPKKCPIGYRNNRGYCQSSPRLKFERAYKVTAPAVNAVTPVEIIIYLYFFFLYSSK